MKAVEIAPNIYWVGAIDWDVRMFHGYHFSTHRGTTYNAYLILDDEPTLVDTVNAPFAEELFARIESVIPLDKIKHVVSNHVEMDHSGAMPALMQRIPQAKVYCSAKGRDGLTQYYGGGWDFHVVKTGDTLSLGKKTLQFIEAPMLHWPDSMFTFVQEDHVLLPNDAFGQHIATSDRYAEGMLEDALDEAVKYYANILMPFSPMVAKKLAEIEALKLDIRMIAPSHGLIWKNPAPIVEAYRRWSHNETKRKAVVVYDTMWGSTEMMARQITEGLTEAGVETKLLRAAVTDRSDILKEVLEAKAVVVGSPTINNDSLSTMAGFLEELHDLKPKGKIGAVFSSYGWGGGAEKKLEGILKESSIEVVEPTFAVKYKPTPEDLVKCHDFGVRIGQAIG